MALTASSAATGNDALTTPTTFSFTPGTILVGDLFVLHIHLGDSSRTITGPTGWDVLYNAGGPEAGAQGATFARTVPTTGDTPYTVSWTGGGTSYAYVCTRFTSNIRGYKAMINQFVWAGTTVDNATSYITSALTVAVPNRLCWAVGSEGSAAITYSSSDTEVAEVGNLNATPERVAMYVTTTDTAVGSVTKTMTPSIANQFHSSTFLAEVKEVPCCTTARIAGEINPAVLRGSRW